MTEQNLSRAELLKAWVEGAELEELHPEAEQILRQESKIMVNGLSLLVLSLMGVLRRYEASTEQMRECNYDDPWLDGYVNGQMAGLSTARTAIGHCVNWISSYGHKN